MPKVTRKVWVFDGSSNEEELNFRLQFFMLRRTKADVKMELPPKTRQVVHLDIPQRQRLPSDMLNLSKASIRRSLDLAADAKLPACVAMAADDLRAGMKIVIATHRKLVAEHIHKELLKKKFRAGLIHSEIGQAARRKVLDEARASSEPFAIVATIDSTSTSIDLSFMNAGLCVELPYVWQTLAQWEARMHRFGQTDPVLLRYAVARGTSDELVLDLLLKKIDFFEKSIGTTGDGLRADLGGSPVSEEDALDDLFARIKAKVEAEQKAEKKRRRAS